MTARLLIKHWSYKESIDWVAPDIVLIVPLPYNLMDVKGVLSGSEIEWPSGEDRDNLNSDSDKSKNLQVKKSSSVVFKERKIK